MARGSNPLERTSVQLMLGVALIALCANSAVDRTEDGVIPPWGRVRFGLGCGSTRSGARPSPHSHRSLALPQPRPWATLSVQACRGR